MVTLGFCNLKGGVGKTTACQNIAVALAKAGRKIAVIDMDPQSNLSAGFGVTPGSTDPQVFDLLTGDAKWDDIVRCKEDVDIIPSSLNLVMAELHDSGPFTSDSLLREALEQISPDRYDYIIIDSPPQLGIFTRNVLAACDKIIVPMDGGFYSLFGLKLLESSLSVLRERLGNNLDILGILMTNYNPRLYIAHSIFEEVKKSFGDILFESYVSQSVSLIEATSMGLSIFEYSPKSKAAQCYKEVAEELIKRLEGKADKIEIPKRKPGRRKKTQETQDQEASEPALPDPEPEPLPTLEEPEPDLNLSLESSNEIPEKIELPPEPILEEVQAPKPSHAQPSTSSAGAYEQGIKQDLIDLLPERQKSIWAQILAPINDISRGEIDIKELRDDFMNSDKYRYTFYIFNDEEEKLTPVAFPDQIVEPLQCVVKLDENGSAEIFF